MFTNHTCWVRREDVLLIAMLCELSHGGLLNKPQLTSYVLTCESSHSFEMFDNMSVLQSFPLECETDKSKEDWNLQTCSSKKDLLASTEAHLGKTPELSPSEKIF